MPRFATTRREEYRLAVVAGDEALDGCAADEEVGLGSEDDERWIGRGG